MPGKRTPSALEQPDDAYLRVSGPLGPERPVLHRGVPVPHALTGKSLTDTNTAIVGILIKENKRMSIRRTKTIKIAKNSLFP